MKLNILIIFSQIISFRSAIFSFSFIFMRKRPWKKKSGKKYEEQANSFTVSWGRRQPRLAKIEGSLG